MPKSTPLNQLRNRQPEQPLPPVEEQNENDLVNEILQEIDEENNFPAPAPMSEEPTYEEDIYVPPQQPQPQQQFYQNALPVAEPTPEPEKDMLDSVKDHIVVGLIVLFLSLPFVDNFIPKLLPKREMIAKYLDYVVLLVKAILGVLMSFVYQNFM
tara:strand:- start:14 stop:478 length:465 start_codon:yes stop_codon:yes gene_type:complete